MIPVNAWRYNSGLVARWLLSVAVVFLFLLMIPTTTRAATCQSQGGTCQPACDLGSSYSVPADNCGTSDCCIAYSGTGNGNNGGNSGSANCSGGLTNVAGICVPTGAATGLSDKPVMDIVKNLMNWILAIFGFIAIIGFVISGLQYLFSTGDEGMAETAKRNMKYCIIGIVVALSAWVIIQAIDAALTATNVAF